MSFENRAGNSAPVYTISPGGFQSGGHYGFRDELLRQPPPRYEDVVSGEYLNKNYTNVQLPAAYPVNSVQDCSLPPPPPPLQIDLQQYHQGQKEKTSRTWWAFLVAILLCVIFIWRITWQVR